MAIDSYLQGLRTANDINKHFNQNKVAFYPVQFKKVIGAMYLTHKNYKREKP